MKKKKIIPRGKYALVRPDEPESATQSVSGLSVPQNTDKEQRAQGIVEAVSPQITDLKKGDRVIFGAYAGEVVQTAEDEFKLLHDDDIIGIILDA